MLGISQGRLGRHLGLTFSQVQKYEKGTNRIGAGRLYQIAAFLGVQPGYFFAGLDEAEQAADDPTVVRRKGEVSSLNEAFDAIHDPETRASILALVMSLAGESLRPRSAGLIRPPDDWLRVSGRRRIPLFRQGFGGDGRRMETGRKPAIRIESVIGTETQHRAGAAEPNHSPGVRMTGAPDE